MLQGIAINKASTTHRYLQLYRQMADRIESGQWVANEKLPPIRHAAKLLGINMSTVVHAYNMLEANGRVYKKRGSGTYVSPSVNRVGTTGDNHLMSIDARTSNHTIAINLSNAKASTDLFPVHAFKMALNTVLDRDRGEAFSHDDSRGFYALRQALANRILKPTGIDITAERIQILSGAQQGIDVVAKALVNYGDTVLVEAPTYRGALAIFKSRGARIVSLPMTSNGPDLKNLHAHLLQYKPKLFYAMPTIHNPTGVVYTDAVKQRLVELCHRYHCYIVEDDFSSDLYMGEGTLYPMSAMAGAERVVYIKSFSKSLMPGLRMGLMTLPLAIERELITAKQSTDIVTSGLTQRAFDHFIRSGAYDEQKKTMMVKLRERYLSHSQYISSVLAECCEIGSQHGGFNFWLTMKNGQSSQLLFDRLKARGVLIAPGHAFYDHLEDSASFRLTVSSIQTHHLILGLQAIYETILNLPKAN